MEWIWNKRRKLWANFLGEFLNGKRNGKGTVYYYNGNLEFEGEYLNGQRNEKERILF